MKMKDVFELPIVTADNDLCSPFNEGQVLRDKNGVSIGILNNNKYCKSVARSINLHDEMYKELEEIHKIISYFYGDATGLHIALGKGFIKSSGDLLAKARGEK